MNKTQKVKEHLLKHSSITSWDAINLYGETRLASIICNLRYRGWNIESVWKKGTDRNGNDSRWVEYIYFAEDGDE